MITIKDKNIHIEEMKKKVGHEFVNSKYRLNRYKEHSSIIFAYIPEQFGISSLLKESLRLTDDCFNIEDDIYCIILHNLDFKDAYKVAQKIVNPFCFNQQYCFASLIEIEKDKKLHSIIVDSLKMIKILVDSDSCGIMDYTHFENSII